MQIAFPLRFDGRGRTAEADEDRHVRDLVEQVLFTSPGERVNRPDFGSGALQLAFAPAGDALAAAARSAVHGALQRWLAEQVLVEDVAATADEATLTLTVRYLVRRNGQHRSAEFSGAVGAP
jgi:uncharacterized protein